jgi:outer membrane lipoprotein SlyB
MKGNKMKKIKLLIAVLTALSAAGCATSGLSGSDYSTQGVRQAGSAIKGTVIDVRKINITASNTASNVGKGAGAVIGGAAGAGIAGKNNYAKVVAGTLGAVLGGVAGDKITDHVANQAGVEVIVATEKGGTVVLSQSTSDGANFNIGDNVWVVTSGGAVRAVRRN